MLTRIALALLVSWPFLAWSQASDKGVKQELKQPPQTKGASADDRNISHPAISITVSPTLTAKNGPANKGGAEENKAVHWEMLTGLSTAALAIITFGLAYFTYWLWRSTRDLVRTTEDAAKAIERAFVKMSHVPPGLEINEEMKAYLLLVEIKNWGNTPARVKRFTLTHKVLPEGANLPQVPSYGDHPGVAEAFLVTQDRLLYSTPVVVGGDFDDIEAGKMKLYLFGYVDYVDIFKKEHRAGYGREYLEGMPLSRDAFASDKEFEARSNLAYITQEGYNYDHPKA